MSCLQEAQIDELGRIANLEEVAETQWHSLQIWHAVLDLPKFSRYHRAAGGEAESVVE